MHIKQHTLTHSRRNVILCYAQVRTHLPPLESRKTKSTSIKRFNCSEGERENRELQGCRWLMISKLFKKIAFVLSEISTNQTKNEKHKFLNKFNETRWESFI